MYGNQPDLAGSFLTVFIDVYQTWLISNLITILPELVPFLIRVNKLMEINQMWVISNCFYRCLPDLGDF